MLLYERMQMGQRRLGSISRKYAFRTEPNTVGDDACSGGGGGTWEAAKRAESIRARNEDTISLGGELSKLLDAASVLSH